MKKFDFGKLYNQGNILIIGCGGGFDAGSAIPLWAHLKRSTDKKRQIFLGGVQEPTIGNFMDSEPVGSPPLSAICWLTPQTRLSPNYSDHPVLTVRRCPELQISHSLGMPVVYISASKDIREMLKELLRFCKENDVQTIFTVDTGIDSHVSQSAQGNLGDPEIDCWTRDLLVAASDYNIESYLANVCVGVETWISEDVQESFENALHGQRYQGNWTPSKNDTAGFFEAWQYSKDLLGFEPSNTGYVLHQALSGVRGGVELPHSRGTFVEINETTIDYYIFKLEK